MQLRVAVRDKDRSSFLRGCLKRKETEGTEYLAIVIFPGDKRTLIQQLLLGSFHANIYVDLQKAVRPAMDVVM
jgi:hypothetical protein